MRTLLMATSTALTRAPMMSFETLWPIAHTQWLCMTHSKPPESLACCKSVLRRPL